MFSLSIPRAQESELVRVRSFSPVFFSITFLFDYIDAYSNGIGHFDAVARGEISNRVLERVAKHRLVFVLCAWFAWAVLLF